MADTSTDAKPVLKVDHYVKRYGKKTSVDDVSIELNAGDIFGFVGHNGAGKTTLIRSIIGAQSIDGGSIEICGIDVTKHPVDAKRLLAYVPDNPDVYPFMTGMQYLSYIADAYRVSDDDRRRHATELAERLELVDALGDTISSYSHGMRQKLVIIGALLHDPKLIVLDEPFVGLDPIATHALRKLLVERSAGGCAVFFSSHVLEVVEKLCNKVGIIRQGRLVAYGDTDDIRGDKSLENVFLELSEVSE